MPWFNTDSKLHSHPKPRRAGLEAMGLWAVAGAYCADILTDGFVPDWYIETWPKGHKLAQKLIEAQLWDQADGGYQFRSWAEYQRTKEQVEEAKAEARERQRRHRASKKTDPNVTRDSQRD